MPLRRRARCERGSTLVELSVAASIGMGLLAIVSTVLHATRSNLDRQLSRQESNDQARLAIVAIDREIRSGNVFYDPAAEDFSPGDVAPGMAFRAYTQTNAPTRGGPRCVQFRITAQGTLQRRDWTTDWQDDPGTSVSAWRTIAEGLRNRSDGVSAFDRAQPNTLVIDLRVSDDPGKGRTVQIRNAIVGRNTVFYSNNELCGPTTPDPSLQGAGGSAVPEY